MNAKELILLLQDMIIKKEISEESPVFIGEISDSLVEYYEINKEHFLKQNNESEPVVLIKGNSVSG